MKQRNPDARCENCPYFDNTTGREAEMCLRHAPMPASWTVYDETGKAKFELYESDNGTFYPPATYPNAVCGEHPEFFKESIE